MGAKFGLLNAMDVAADMHIQTEWYINIWTQQYFGIVTFLRKLNTDAALQINIAWLSCRAK